MSEVANKFNHVILDRIEKELERRVYEKSYYEFFKVAFCQLHPGDEYDENWHAKYLCDQLQAEFERIKKREPRKRDMIINMPFRAAKSMITTIIFPVWCWSQDPSMKFISVSYSGDLAIEHARRSKDLVNSAWFQRLYGHKVVIRGDLSGASHYETTAGGMRKAVGTGGQITGSGADIIIVDDPQNPKKAASEVERQNAKDFYDHTLYSRLNRLDVGVRIIVMQRLHEEDLTGHLMAQRPEDHQQICMPARLDEQILSPPDLKSYYVNGLFWPSRFSDATIRSFEKSLGSLQAAGQLGQRPAPLEGNMVKRVWFRIVKPYDLRKPANQAINFFLDTAYTEKTTNDPTGLFACFKGEDGNVYLLNATSVNMIFPDLVKYVKEYVKLHGYTSGSIIRVEPKASGKSLVQQLGREQSHLGSNFNIVEITGDMLKDDKITRLAAVSAPLQAGKVVLVEGNWNEAYLTQLCSFPNVKHDEYVDLTAYMVKEMIQEDGFFWSFL